MKILHLIDLTGRVLYYEKGKKYYLVPGNVAI
jgi:hypothetical protein